MTKTYMLTFNDLEMPREAILRFLDTRTEVSNWHASTLHNLVFVVSDSTGEELSRVLKDEAGLSEFILAEVDEPMIGRQVYGWLPRETWDFIQKRSVRPQMSSATES